MSMLSSCTLLSLVPPAVPAPAPGNFSPAALQLRTNQPAASPSAVALHRPAPRYKVSRALRLVCHANTYNIPPTALVHPSSAKQGIWKITNEEDRITLEFKVGDKTKEDNLEVTATWEQALNVWLLVIRYKVGNVSDESLATSLDACLLMPPGYDDKNVMTAEIISDWLYIFISKPKQEPKTIKVTKRDQAQSNQ